VVTNCLTTTKVLKNKNLHTEILWEFNLNPHHGKRSEAQRNFFIYQLVNKVLPQITTYPKHQRRTVRSITLETIPGKPSRSN